MKMLEYIVSKLLPSTRRVVTGVEQHLEDTSDYSYVQYGSGVQFQAQAYSLCPPLQEVIGRRAQGLLNGKLMPVDSQGVVIKSSGFDAAMKVLSQPNVFENRTQFFANISTYIDVFGVCYVYKGQSVGFSETTSLIIIPNTCITALYKGVADVLGNAPVVESYTVNMFGKTWTFRGEDVRRIIEIRDRTVNLGMPMKSYSRIDGLKYPIQNIIASLESRNQIIVKRGADVVLSPEATNDKGVNATFLGDKEVNDLQTAYLQYGLQKGKYGTMIPRVPVKVQHITRNPKDLGLLDGEDQDIRAILRAYNYPATVFGIKDENKYNTYLEGKAEAYEDGIIPHAKIICEGLDDIFDSNNNGFWFYMDFSHLQCMQRSEKDRAFALEKEVKALNEAVGSGLLSMDEAKEQIKDYLR